MAVGFEWRLCWKSTSKNQKLFKFWKCISKIRKAGFAERGGILRAGGGVVNCGNLAPLQGAVFCVMFSGGVARQASLNHRLSSVKPPA
jgi:hypothetical protein